MKMLRPGSTHNLNRFLLAHSFRSWLALLFPLRCRCFHTFTGYLLIVACCFVIVATVLCLLCIRGNIATAFDSRCHRHRRSCCRIRIHSTTFALLLCLPSLVLPLPIPLWPSPPKMFSLFSSISPSPFLPNCNRAEPTGRSAEIMRILWSWAPLQSGFAWGKATNWRVFRDCLSLDYPLQYPRKLR